MLRQGGPGSSNAGRRTFALQPAMNLLSRTSQARHAHINRPPLDMRTPPAFLCDIPNDDVGNRQRQHWDTFFPKQAGGHTLTTGRVAIAGDRLLILGKVEPVLCLSCPLPLSVCTFLQRENNKKICFSRGEREKKGSEEEEQRERKSASGHSASLRRPDWAASQFLLLEFFPLSQATPRSAPFEVHRPAEPTRQKPWPRPR